MKKSLACLLLLSVIITLIPPALAEVTHPNNSATPEPVEVVFQGPPRLRQSVVADDGRTVDVDYRKPVVGGNFSCFTITPHPKTGLLPKTASFKAETLTMTITTNQYQLPKLYVVTFRPDFKINSLVLECLTPNGEVYQDKTVSTGNHGLKVAYSTIGSQVHLTAFDWAYSRTEPVVEFDFDASPIDLFYWDGGKLPLETEHLFTGEKVTLTIDGVWAIYYPYMKMSLMEIYDLNIPADQVDFEGDLYLDD